MMVEVEDDPRETLMYVAAQTKEMARVEKEVYAPILRQWHPCPAAIAAVTLHACFGTYFKWFVSKMDGCLSSESMRALQTASDLDKYLVQMAHDDDGAGHGSKKMIPYDVDSIVVSLVTEWMDDRLQIGAECVRRARDSETWNPGSKSEPYAQSAVDLMKLAKVTVDVLMEIHQRWPMSEPFQNLADGIDRLVHRYSSFLASSCGAGTKEGYTPQLPPLTRCGQDKRLLHQLLLNLNCVAGGGNGEAAIATTARAMTRVRPTTSGATQRLYARLNTLHYMLGVLHSIDRSLAPRGQQRHIIGHRRARSSFFDRAYPAVEAAIVHVTELSGYRLVFLDSAHYFHQILYQGGVAEARIGPALCIMKQNMAFLCSVVSDRAQPLAVREVMKASIEAFLMALLAGGSGRAFSREDSSADLASLMRLFCSCGEGLVTEEVVEMEFAAAEGVVDLMGLPMEKLIDEFRRSSSGCMMMIPPMTRRWIRSDANTLLHVLCHRDHEAASRFLKKTFDLPKRR
uniref:Uncharacterized protein n=1 Tax=Avena sativa TaxID=4498 RepID=A0ACD5YLK9_AVESA